MQGIAMAASLDDKVRLNRSGFSIFQPALLMYVYYNKSSVSKSFHRSQK